MKTRELAMKRQGIGAVMTMAVGVLFTAGCGPNALEESRARPVITRYAEMVSTNYTDALTQAQALKVAVDNFVANPTDAGLKAARQAWLTSRDPYSQSETYRFYGGPIDNDETGPEGRINSWPLDESFIDSVQGNPNSGIINSQDVLSEDYLAAANERGDSEVNIATGYHAIEFLLWGQDFNANGPGDRPYTDFVDGSKNTRPNADRRRAYLSLVTNMLVEDLTSVQTQWTASQDNYRKEFTSEAPKDAVLKMLTGMGSLSGAELSGERMTVAYDNKDQEDEHSCFSDNTPADLYNNALGIQNVYLGRYGGVEGPGLDDLVAAVDPKLNEEMKQRLQASIDAIQAIPKPFDQAILGDDSAPGRQKIKAAIDALHAQTDTTVKVATALGVQINLE